MALIREVNIKIYFGHLIHNWFIYRLRNISHAEDGVLMLKDTVQMMYKTIMVFHEI